MANKRIIELTTENSVTNDMYIAVDDSGFAETKKATVEEVTEIERTARQVQDNVIEASCGLNADGSFTPPAASNYMTAADYAAAGLTENLLNGMLLLDAHIYEYDVELIVREVELSVAQINTLYSLPVTLVDISTLGANVVIDVIDAVAWIDWGSVAWNVGSQTLDIGYTTGADILTFTEAFVESNANLVQKATPTDNAAMSKGKNVVARFASSNPTAPPGDSKITISISYRLIET